MALNAATDFTDLYLIAGGGTPAASQIAGGRALALTGSGTPPRFLSSKRRRGGEFRSATFSATTPKAFATTAAARADLYASSKVKSFTAGWWVRPNKTGVTSTALTVLGGVFSATNMGATPWIHNQPVLVCTTGDAGSSRVVVSVMGATLDTSLATQDSGPVSTTPLSDGDWNLVVVRVTGSTSTNNLLSAMTLMTISPTGQRRVYSLSAHRSALKVAFNATNPAANDTFTIGSKVYTAKASLAGGTATTTIVGTGTNPAAGETLVVGDKTYIFTAQVAAAAKASSYIHLLTPGTKKNQGWNLWIGGYAFKAVIGGAAANPGDMCIYGGYEAPSLNDLLFNPTVTGEGPKGYKAPAAAVSSGITYTAENAGKAWRDRNFTTPSTDVAVSFDTPTQKLTIQALSVGAGGNSTKIKTKDSATATGTHPEIAVGNASGDAADNTEIAFQGGLAAPVAYGVMIGGSYATTKASLIAAINANGSAGTQYTADIATAGANPKAVASDPGGNNILLTALVKGSAGNSIACSDTSAQLTTAAFTGGTDGADENHILLGGTAQATWENLASAVNLTGARGIAYGSPTTINADLAAAASTGYLLITGLASGASGNGKAVSFSLSGGASATVRDEWGDKTQTTTVGGSDAAPFTVAAGSRPDQADVQFLAGGWTQTATTTAGIFYGAASDCFLANRVLTDAEVAEYAYTAPPTSARDAGWYRAAHRVRIAGKSDLMSAWTAPIPTAIGATSTRLQMSLRGTRHALRAYGVEAGRPWSLSHLGYTFDRLGGLTPAGRRYYTFPHFKGGTYRNQPPPLVPQGACYDMLNMTFQNGVARRRRGYRIKSVDTSVTGFPSAIFDCTTAAGDTYQVVYRGGTLYLYDNGTEVSLDTGWAQNEIPTKATVGNKTLLMSSQRSRVLIDGSTVAAGVTAPTSAPSYVSSAPTGDTGVILAPPGFEYVCTFYDGTHNTDSGPSPSTTVSLGGTNPNKNPVKALFRLPVGGSGVTKRKLWRSKVGTQTYFLVATIEDNVAATEVYDPYDIPASGEILEVYSGIGVTAAVPAGTACGSHENRTMVWGDPADLNALYIGEIGDCERYYAFNVVRANGPIRAGISHEGRWVLFTDRTVEVIEGDFVRGAAGLLGISKRVLDSSKGAFGPYAATAARGRIFWCDPNGVHTLGAGLDQKDVTTTVSWPVHPIVAAALDTSGTTVCMEFDYVSQQLWVALTQAQADTATKNRVVLVLDVSKGFSQTDAVWAPYDHALSFVTRSADGLLGQQFLGCGYNGEILELDVTDGDGVQGNESWFPTPHPVISAIDTATKIVTVTGVTLPTTGLRGAGAVLEVLASTTNRFSHAGILASTASTLTLDRLPAGLAVGDLVHVGGILGMLQTAEVDAGSSDPKIMREVGVGLVEAHAGDL